MFCSGIHTIYNSFSAVSYTHLAAVEIVPYAKPFKNLTVSKIIILAEIKYAAVVSK